MSNRQYTVKPEDQPILQMMFGHDIEILTATVCAQDGCRFYLGVRASRVLYFVAITRSEQQAQLVLDELPDELPDSTLQRQLSTWRQSHRCRNCAHCAQESEASYAQMAQPCAAS